MVQTEFVFKYIRRDIKALFADNTIEKTETTILHVIERWEEAYEQDGELKDLEKTVLEFLEKPNRPTPESGRKIMEMIMYMHAPLIHGYNDVIGIKLRDADIMRVMNKMTGRPLEEGVSEYNREISRMIEERKEKKRKEKERLEKQKEE